MLHHNITAIQAVFSSMCIVHVDILMTIDLYYIVHKFSHQYEYKQSPSQVPAYFLDSPNLVDLRVSYKHCL